MARRTKPKVKHQPVAVAGVWTAPVRGAVGRPALFKTLRILLGILFVWAALSKLANPTGFLGDLYGYELPLPRGFWMAVAVVLPWVELLCGLMLLSGWWLETALTLTAVLVAGFLVATLQAWVRGLQISCGCFDLGLLGLDPEGGLARFIESPGFAVVRNLALAAVTVYLLRPVWARPGGHPAT